MPLHRRNHSLFGNKWTHGKWAQAGGKKQSVHVPLFSAVTSPSAQAPMLNYPAPMGVQEVGALQQQAAMMNQPVYWPTPSDSYLRASSPVDGQLR